MFHPSLTARLLLIASLPPIMVAVGLSYYHMTQRFTEFDRHILTSTKSSAQRIATIAQAGLLTDDRSALTEQIERQIETNPMLQYARIEDAEGGLVMEHGPATTHPHLPTPLGKEIPTRFSASIHTLGTPERKLGSAEVHLDTDWVGEAHATELQNALGFGLISLIAAGFVSAGLLRWITRPIEQITQTVERIAAGDLDVRIVPQSAGELGRLEIGIAEIIGEIRSEQASLEIRVRDATQQLEETLDELERRNRELEEARRTAESASDFKSRFLATISHEIRTPMNSILGFTELLRSQELDPIHADYVDTIHHSASSLLSLINAILDLSKIESGHMELEPVDVDINHILAEIFQLIAPEAFRRGVEFLVLPLPPNQSRWSVDPVRLKQILLNLAGNAVKFTDDGHVLLLASLSDDSSDTREVHFRVEDTGCGISREDHNRLFQAFAQGEQRQEDNQSTTGTGLGLHIASELIFLMGGDLELHSEPERGSTFDIRLPLSQASASEQSERPPLLRPGRILLIEPRSPLQAMLAQFIRMAGAPCKTLDSLQTAARIARADDIVLINIPSQSVKSQRLPEHPIALARTGAIIAAHAYTHDIHTRATAVQAGYDGVIYKTGALETLRQSLDLLVEGRHAAGSNTTFEKARQTQQQISPNQGASACALDVLVVDDHPINRKLVETYLTGGCRITHAASAEEALLECCSHRFDAILLDLHLPDLRGTEVAHRLRGESGPNQHTPVLAITADILALHNEQIDAAGIDELLIKPIGQHDLSSRIADHARRRKGTRPNSDPLPPATTAAQLGGSGNSATPEERQASMVEELRAMLYRSLPESRHAIENALDRGNVERLHAAVHRLQGAVAYCDQPTFHGEILAVERAARRALEDGSEVEATSLARALLGTIDQIMTCPPTD